eukprot:scaffold9753_cov160-Amphora_coffeaeformis.AAC.6
MMCNDETLDMGRKLGNLNTEELAAGKTFLVTQTIWLFFAIAFSTKAPPRAAVYFCMVCGALVIPSTSNSSYSTGFTFTGTIYVWRSHNNLYLPRHLFLPFPLRVHEPSVSCYHYHCCDLCRLVLRQSIWQCTTMTTRIARFTLHDGSCLRMRDWHGVD